MNHRDTEGTEKSTEIEYDTTRGGTGRWIAIIGATFCWIVGSLLVLSGLFMGGVMVYYNATMGPIEWSPDQDALNQIALTAGNVGYVGLTVLAGACFVAAAFSWQRGPAKRATVWTVVAFALSMAGVALIPM